MQVLQPFLALAEPVSDGQLVRSFRECWACAPWGQATFHARNPGLSVMRDFLCKLKCFGRSSYTSRKLQRLLTSSHLSCADLGTANL